MKEKNVYLRRRAIAIALASSLLLTGCGYSKRKNNNDSGTHYHYIIGYGDKTFLIRECETDVRVRHIPNSGEVCVDDYSEMLSSGFTRIKINSEEEEDFYRNIEDEQIDDGKMFIYKRK